MHFDKKCLWRLFQHRKNGFLDDRQRVGDLVLVYLTGCKECLCVFTVYPVSVVVYVVEGVVLTDGLSLIIELLCRFEIVDTDVGDSLHIADDFTVDAVPAYNTTEANKKFHHKGRDNGFILTIDGLRIYIAGDTEDIPEMSAIKNIDIAFLPCNQPFTMTPEQLVRAAKTVKPKILFPYHYGQTNLSGVSDQLKEDGVEVRIRHYE